MKAGGRAGFAGVGFVDEGNQTDRQAEDNRPGRWEVCESKVGCDNILKLTISSEL